MAVKILADMPLNRIKKVQLSISRLRVASILQLKAQTSQ